MKLDEYVDDTIDFVSGIGCGCLTVGSIFVFVVWSVKWMLGV